MLIFIIAYCIEYYLTEAAKKVNLAITSDLKDEIFELWINIIVNLQFTRKFNKVVLMLINSLRNILISLRVLIILLISVFIISKEQNH